MPNIISVLILCSLAAGQGEQLWRTVREPLSLSELPSHVRAFNNELTLFADFDDVRGENVVLYLVNRTPDPVRLSAQDSDIYVKLEFRNDEGEWVRAQTHRHSSCGNSYMNPPVLEVDHFLKFLGYFPSEGETRAVRYRRYAGKLDLVSNEGRGRVSLAVVEAASTDPMAIRTGNLSFLSRVARGELEIPQPKKKLLRRKPRESAIAALAQKRFKPEDVIPVLENLLNDENEEIAQQARSSLLRVKQRQNRVNNGS